MTNESTPISEIARILSPSAARTLLSEPMENHALLLSAVRAALVSWEEDGTIMDPITLETKLDAFVSRLVSKRW